MDKSLLFKNRLPEAEVPVPGVGTVRVRGLSRFETVLVAKLQEQRGGYDAVVERRTLHYGMVDPTITEAEAERWQDASPGGEIEAITRKIQELSGLITDSKSDLSGVRDEPGAGVRVLPGAEAVDDGGRDAPDE